MSFSEVSDYRERNEKLQCKYSQDKIWNITNIKYENSILKILPSFSLKIKLSLYEERTDSSILNPLIPLEK